MSFLNKEYVLEKQENFEAFINTLENLPAEVKQAIVTHKPTVSFTKDGDMYTMRTLLPNKHYQTVSFKNGVEVDEEAFGNKCKTTFNVSGDTITQKQVFDKGTITIVRKFSGDQLELTLTSDAWNGTVKRYYKAA